MARALGELGVALDAVEAEAEGVVRLTAPPGVADVFVAPALARFHALHPKVRVDLDASIGYADLTRGEADPRFARAGRSAATSSCKNS